MQSLKKKDKIMLALIGASVIVFAVMDPYYFIWKSPPGAEAVPPPVQFISAPVPGVVVGGVSPAGGARPAAMLKRERIPLDGWGSDPFVQPRRQSNMVSRLEELRLGVISVKGGDRYALINSKVVKAGDDVAGFKIARIDKDRVILTSDGQDYLLTWEE